jgi:hypothetical protein
MRYATRPAGYAADDCAFEPREDRQTVVVLVHDGVDTGLVDENGDRLYRFIDPIGFTAKV